MTLPATEAGALAALAAHDADNTRIAAIAKALGHPARVRIVKLLLAKRSCIGCDIVEDVGLAQSTVSEHLRILKAAGIISGEIERPRICYSLVPGSLDPLADFLDALVEPDEPAHDADIHALASDPR
ncbi:MAG: ArsR/SmtB family transcription factor [Salinarimonas sp.]